MKTFSFLIKKIGKNSKKQFRNAHNIVIAARIISCNLKVDWSIQNKRESKIEKSGTPPSPPQELNGRPVNNNKTSLHGILQLMMCQKYHWCGDQQFLKNSP